MALGPIPPGAESIRCRPGAGDHQARQGDWQGNRGLGSLAQHKGPAGSRRKDEIWQVNAAGRYAHKTDSSKVPLDPNFEGFASLVADKDGAYRFLIIGPGAYKVGSN